MCFVPMKIKINKEKKGKKTDSGEKLIKISDIHNFVVQESENA